MNAHKDRTAETERVKERKRARVERGAGDVLMDPENRDDEQMAVRHAVGSGGDITENQHEENRMRDIHVGKRGSEAASCEEQPDMLRETVRFEQEAPIASASSDPLVALEYPASGEAQDWLGSVLVQWSGHVDDDVQISRWVRSTRWMDERVVTSEKCWIAVEEKMLQISREVNYNGLVENLTCLNALEETDEKINLKILMDEKSWKTWKKEPEDRVKKLVQNGVMNEIIVKNFVMNAQIDPKVVMDLSKFKIGGWKTVCNPSIKKCWKNFLMRMNLGC